MTSEISDLDLKEAGAQLAAESARFASFGWMRGPPGICPWWWGGIPCGWR